MVDRVCFAGRIIAFDVRIIDLIVLSVVPDSVYWSFKRNAMVVFIKLIYLPSWDNKINNGDFSQDNVQAQSAGQSENIITYIT